MTEEVPMMRKPTAMFGSRHGSRHSPQSVVGTKCEATVATVASTLSTDLASASEGEGKEVGMGAPPRDGAQAPLTGPQGH